MGFASKTLDFTYLILFIRSYFEDNIRARARRRSLTCSSKQPGGARHAAEAPNVHVLRTVNNSVHIIDQSVLTAER